MQDVAEAMLYSFLCFLRNKWREFWACGNKWTSVAHSGTGLNRTSLIWPLLNADRNKHQKQRSTEQHLPRTSVTPLRTVRAAYSPLNKQVTNIFIKNRGATYQQWMSVLEATSASISAQVTFEYTRRLTEDDLNWRHRPLGNYPSKKGDSAQRSDSMSNRAATADNQA